MSSINDVMLSSKVDQILTCAVKNNGIEVVKNEAWIENPETFSRLVHFENIGNKVN